MSISGISSGTYVYQNQFQQTRKDFTTLQSDLSSGNLTGSQQAFAALMQDIQNAGQAQSGQQASGNSQISNDLAAVGSALQSGDLSTAQSAFATLTQDVESAAQSTSQVQGGAQAYKGHGHHHHHHHGGASQTTATTLSSDLAAVGSALQSGDLSTAQTAFATLLQDLSTTGQSTAAASVATAATQAVGSNINTIV
jgi:hypothetical protein